MNNRRILSIGCALAISAVPLHANAMSSRAGLEACARAMVNDLASEQGKPMEFNLDPESKSGRKKLGRREVFHLDATTPDGGEVLARMDCVVNNKAKVTQLIEVPLDGEDARVRATTFN